MKSAFIADLIGWKYRHLARPVLFRCDSEAVHTQCTRLGERLGRSTMLQSLAHRWEKHDPMLSQTLHGITFANPIGLAAGFDYEARLPLTLPMLGFGFGTVGTITNRAYEGNQLPRLGRLPRSRSLVVNKGFKNEGIEKLIVKHRHSHFPVPIGLSIGKTNDARMTQSEAVGDIVSAFTRAEVARLPFAHYELNISCPNLHGAADFYAPHKLRELLQALVACHITKPIFVKMPISKTDDETIALLDVITSFPIAGVIFGNLQQCRDLPCIDQEEQKKYPRGGLSGKATWDRSNELIALAYHRYGKQLSVIGCGGVFSAEDAYMKIKLGASLVQLITGLIFEGPQLPLQINFALPGLLARDGFKHISEAIGVEANR